MFQNVHKQDLFESSNHGTATHPPCEHHDGPCEPCSDLTEIEAQLKDLHERHRQARARRNLVHNGPLIHRFPPEIVARIFTLAFPPREAFHCNGPDEEVSSLILAEVCQTWRELAFSTPRLWCSISVNAGEPNLPLLNHQVLHSGMTPLSIHLFWLSDDSPTLSKQVVSFVVEQLHRTSSLRLDLPEDCITELSAALGSPNAAPLLDDVHCATFPLKFAIKPLARQRHSVLLEWLRCDQSCLEDISHLTLKGGCSGRALSEILASKELEHLALEWTGDILREQTLVGCRSIEVLMLRRFDSAEFMFKETSLPSLQNLEIKVEKMHLLYPMMADFLRRSLCQLQVLIIHHWGEQMSKVGGNSLIQSLIIALKSTNTLQHLTLESYEGFVASNPEPLVQRLLLERDFLPRLETLSLRTRCMLPIDLLLNVMTGDGNSSVRPLSKLNLELWMTLLEVGLFMRDDVQRILQSRAAGKTISIGCALKWDLPELASDVVLYWKHKYGL